MSALQEKYGFIYIWRDRKYNRYYIGSHWGREDDGYICSSKWMRKSHLYRKNDFKRRIIERVFDRSQIFIREQYWLNKIKPSEIKVRYYNLTLTVKDPWYNDPNKRISIGEKISKKRLGISTGSRSEETKRKMSEVKKRRQQERLAAGTSKYKESALRRAPSMIGAKQPEETKLKRKESLRIYYENNVSKNLGRKRLNNKNKQK